MSFIFSLTSYPGRFEYLDQVIESLDSQNIKSDGIILNIAKEDRKRLKLKSYKNVHIYFVNDLKAAKKLLPTLKRFPNYRTITVDDDVVYPTHLSEELLRGHEDNPNHIIAGRAREIRKNKEGNFRSYNDWYIRFDGRPSAPNLVPTGVGGVLYPPNIFHRDVLDKKLIKDFTTTDDLWWYAQARRNDVNFVQVPIFDEAKFPNIFPIAARGLFYYKNRSENDIAFQKLLDLYGNFTGI